MRHEVCGIGALDNYPKFLEQIRVLEHGSSRSSVFAIRQVLTTEVAIPAIGVVTSFKKNQ